VYAEIAIAFALPLSFSTRRTGRICGLSVTTARSMISLPCRTRSR
jgi:hypothetical protein